MILYNKVRQTNSRDKLITWWYIETWKAKSDKSEMAGGSLQDAMRFRGSLTKLSNVKYFSSAHCKSSSSIFIALMWRWLTWWLVQPKNNKTVITDWNYFFLVEYTIRCDENDENRTQTYRKSMISTGKDSVSEFGRLIQPSWLMSPL